MRIQGGTNPLDGTSVHPESYEAAGKFLEKQGFKPEDIAGGKLAGLSLTIKDYKKLAEELGIGEITLRDIVKELEKPARDPRDEMPKPKSMTFRTVPFRIIPSFRSAVDRCRAVSA